MGMNWVTKTSSLSLTCKWEPLDIRPGFSAHKVMSGGIRLKRVKEFVTSKHVFAKDCSPKPTYRLNLDLPEEAGMNYYHSPCLADKSLVRGRLRNVMI